MFDRVAYYRLVALLVVLAVMSEAPFGFRPSFVAYSHTSPLPVDFYYISSDILFKVLIDCLPYFSR